VNGTGGFLMRAEAGSGARRCLRKSSAWSAKPSAAAAPIQRLADIVASWFVPAVIVAAVITGRRVGLFGPEPRLAHALVNSVAVPHHRVPMRPRSGDAHVDHGGHRPRREPLAYSSRTPRRWRSWRKLTP